MCNSNSHSSFSILSMPPMFSKVIGEFCTENSFLNRLAGRDDDGATISLPPIRRIGDLSAADSRRLSILRFFAGNATVDTNTFDGIPCCSRTTCNTFRLIIEVGFSLPDVAGPPPPPPAHATVNVKKKRGYVKCNASNAVYSRR